jgi:hypothetical protein
MPILGAGIGAATHAQSDVTYTAEGVIAVNSDTTGIRATQRQLRRARFIASVIELPQVAAGARTMSGSDSSVESIIDRIEVGFVRGSGIVRVEVEDSSEQRAVALANALAVQAMSLARRIVTIRVSGTAVLGDFEETTSEWGIAQSIFTTPPSMDSQTTDAARFGTGSLRVDCPATPACGPILRVYNNFRRDVTYTAEGWARSPAGTTVSMVFGSTPKSFSNSKQRELTPRWKRLVVSWTPATDQSSADVGFQAASRRSTYFIDGVSLFDPVSAPQRELPVGLSRSGEGRAFELGRYASLSPARPIGKRDSRMTTVTWALGGALTGLLVALVAVGLGQAARRRQTAEQQPHT